MLFIGYIMTENDVKKWIQTRKAELKLLSLEFESMNFHRLELLANRILNAHSSGNRIAFVGNGGSASEASHITAEFVSKCRKSHSPLNVISLNESTSVITAIGNDFGFEEVFSRQVEGLLGRGDLLICLSTSGKSKNIIRAIYKALELEVDVILWTGMFSPEIRNIQIWNVESNVTPRIQEVHLVWGHLLSELVESKLTSNYD